jgi:hypothetical protein
MWLSLTDRQVPAATEPPPPLASRCQDIIQYGQPVARFVGPAYPVGQLGDALARSAADMLSALAETPRAPTASKAVAANAAKLLLRNMVCLHREAGLRPLWEVPRDGTY